MDNKPLFARLFSLSPSYWVRMLIAVQLGLLAWQFSPGLSTNGDDARYYLLGQSLAHGHGYRQIEAPTAPVETAFPIAFPLMLALIQAVSSSIMLLKIVMALCGALVTLVCFHYFKRACGRAQLPLIALCATSCLLVEFSSVIMSEIPYLLFSLLALILYDRSVEEPKSKTLFWLAIALSIIPLHFRTLGLAFSAAWIIYNVITKRFSYVWAHLGLLALTVVAFHLLTTWQNSYLLQLALKDSYHPDLGFLSFGDMLSRIAHNGKTYGLYIIANSIAPLPSALPSALRICIALVIMSLVFIGWLRSLLGSMRFAAVYLFFYFCILLMWQWPYERFVAGILPFTIFFFLYGIDGLPLFPLSAEGRLLSSWKNRLASAALPSARRSGAIVWTTAGFLCLFNLYGLPTVLHGKRMVGEDWKNFYSTADWIRINAPAGAVVMSRKPELFFVRSQRPGVIYPFTHTIEKVMQSIDAQKVSYVVMDGFSWTATSMEYLYPVIANYQERFRAVYTLQNPPTVVYAVVQR
jgi:hypothetical protein